MTSANIQESWMAQQTPNLTLDLLLSLWLSLQIHRACCCTSYQLPATINQKPDQASVWTGQCIHFTLLLLHYQESAAVNQVPEEALTSNRTAKAKRMFSFFLFVVCDLSEMRAALKWRL